MRLKLTLIISGKKELPLNYNYPLSAAIYKLLHFGSSEFSEFLHDIGYQEQGKTYKLFSFALRFEKPPRIKNNRFYLKSDKIFLIISSPLIESFIKNFVVGTFQNQIIEVVSENIKTILTVEQVETLLEPNYKNSMYFTLLSPLVLATKKESNGKLIPKYFRYYDDINEITRVFNQNLVNKYKLIHNLEYEGEPLKFRWDTEYIDRRLSKNKKVTKLISASIRGNIINIKANEIPFTLEGNTDLMKVGYECGFGSQNSLGFGLAKTRHKFH
ncbi:MAG: CRISPR-associated endoribonuclease Cas6 [Melioribacteraceae bacterium]|nr:CRISPR-associated endoribonuclease Cas6 [Melioribacteraceae bacterium]